MNIEALAARKKIGLTQAGLAKRVGLTPADIIRIERNNWVPPAAIRRNLAAALTTTEHALFAEFFEGR